MSAPTSHAVPVTNPTKALLLCQHGEELSEQCATSIRSKSIDSLIESQARKNTIIEELAAILPTLDLTQCPDLQRAVGRLREALQAEMSMLTGAVGDLQHELLTVSAAQRRLVQARHYETAVHALSPAGGGHLSTCG